MERVWSEWGLVWELVWVVMGSGWGVKAWVVKAWAWVWVRVGRVEALAVGCLGLARVGARSFQR